MISAISSEGTSGIQAHSSTKNRAVSGESVEWEDGHDDTFERPIYVSSHSAVCEPSNFNEYCVFGQYEVSPSFSSIIFRRPFFLAFVSPKRCVIC